MTMKTAFACALALGFINPVAIAGSPGGIVSATVENDVFTGSDDSYSNGFALTWVSRDTARYADDSFVDGWVDFWSFLPGTTGENTQTFVAWNIAQEMHTPEVISNPIPDPSDQPYAGLLYVDSSLYSFHENWAQAWNLRLGVVGPASLADVTQKEFHSLIGATEPLGWDAQIQNEPVINVSYTAGRGLLEGGQTDRGSWRLSALGSAELGTYTTALGGGLMAEIGWNMPEAISIGGLGNGLSATNAVGAVYEPNWSISSYIVLGGYAVGHFLPLDGPVFRDGPSIGSDDFAALTNLGVAVRKGNFIGSFGVAYGAGPGDDFDDEIDFGVLVLAWQY